MDSNPIIETFFDATQIAVFKVDDDVRVNECNTAASHLLASAASRAFNERLGDALLCIHSLDTTKGCGFSPACLDCNIRNAISECFANGTVVRKRVEINLKNGNFNSPRKFIITVNPVHESNKMYVVLILEDLHLSLLHEKLPVHINCNKPNCIIEDHLIKYSNVIF
jgi:nitrogen fixation/metabolism regulation signal transduction histidine kinase